MSNAQRLHFEHEICTEIVIADQRFNVCASVPICATSKAVQHVSNCELALIH
jgi:hypothetical protein